MFCRILKTVEITQYSPFILSFLEISSEQWGKENISAPNDKKLNNFFTNAGVCQETRCNLCLSWFIDSKVREEGLTLGK